MKNLVILDANFILVPVQLKIDIYSDISNVLGNFQFVIVTETLIEMKKKSEREKGRKFKIELKKSLEFLDITKKKNPELFIDFSLNKQNNMHVDDFLIVIANQLTTEASNVFIATNDRKLRKKAAENGIRSIFIRQNKFISL